MCDYWVSTVKVTGMVRVNHSMIIILTPPIWRKFIGQPFSNLKNWLKNCEIKKLKDEK